MARKRVPFEYRDKMSWPRTLMLVGIACLLTYCIIAGYRQVASASEPRPLTDMPSASQLLEVDGPEYGTIVPYANFTVNFNSRLHIPNWVAWELTRDETQGSEGRSRFQTDTNVAGCPSTHDYTGSGYDRGHMAPAADMKWSAEAMRQCFYMTNISPQSHLLNGGTWKKLEEKCRLWAQADSAVLIVCGPVLNPEPDEFIGDSQVAVPKGFFKVILSPFVNPPRAIGFLMANGKVKGGLQAAAVSVDSVESVTGLDFFSALPDSLEAAIESECRFHYWSTIKPQ